MKLSGGGTHVAPQRRLGKNSFSHIQMISEILDVRATGSHPKGAYAGGRHRIGLSTLAEARFPKGASFGSSRLPHCLTDDSAAKTPWCAAAGRGRVNGGVQAPQGVSSLDRPGRSCYRLSLIK